MRVPVTNVLFVLQRVAGENSARDLGAHQATETQPTVWGKLLPQTGEPPEARYARYRYNHFFFYRSAVDNELNLCSLPVFTEKFWFCRLSLNHKVLHYGDLDESPQGEVPFELLSDKSKIFWNLYFSRWRHVSANNCFITHNETFTSRRCCVCVSRLTLINLSNYEVVTFLFLLVPVSDIKSVVTGKDCPHMKEKSALKQNKVI